jgi:hypothetical protein
MLRLTIDGNEIELYENEPVNLSYQFSNLQEINASSSNFSQTFRVPLTKKNQDYFGAVNEFGLIPDWDPKTKVDAELSYNTIPVMRGFVQVKSVYVQKGKYADVEIVFFGETANLSRDIGDGMLSDLDLSSYDHTLNATNIEASWSGTLSSGAIRYGLPDKGQNWFANQTDNIWTSSNPLEHGDFTPYFRAAKLMEEILSSAGYTMDSEFFENRDNEDIYLLMNNGERAVIGYDATSGDDIPPQLETMLVGLSTDLTGLSAHNPGAAITAWSESTPFYDTGGNFSGGSTFTAPFRAFYTFRINLYGRTNDTTHEFSMVLQNTNVTPVATVWDIFDGDYPGAAFNDQVHNFTSDPILLNAGDTIRVFYEMANSGHTLNLDGDNTISPQSTWWQVLDITDPTSGQTVDVEANMPEMKQIDFVSGLQKMFNLVFIPDRNNPKKLYIEPFNDYLAAGTKKDWTNKIDLSKDLTIEPTTDLQSRRYEWTHSNGKDLVNDLVFKNASRVYGRYRVDDPENDFASGTKEIKSPFAPHVASYIPGTQYAVHRMLVDTDQTDKRIKDPLPRLAYWNGQNNGTIYYYNDANSAVTTLTRYPAFSQYSDLYASVTDDDLGFGTERPFHLVEANPVNTLYFKYWTPFVNQLYSSDARKLTAFFRLTRAELATFEFSDKIYLKDTYWRILSISYDATSEDLVKVELLKVLSDIRDCSHIPNGIDKATGEITFETSTGSTVTTAPEKCCVKYGYVFDASTSKCYQPFEQ